MVRRELLAVCRGSLSKQHVLVLMSLLAVLSLSFGLRDSSLRVTLGVSRGHVLTSHCTSMLLARGHGVTSL